MQVHPPGMQLGSTDQLGSRPPCPLDLFLAGSSNFSHGCVLLRDKVEAVSLMPGPEGPRMSLLAPVTRPSQRQGSPEALHLLGLCHRAGRNCWGPSLETGPTPIEGGNEKSMTRLYSNLDSYILLCTSRILFLMNKVASFTF